MTVREHDKPLMRYAGWTVPLILGIGFLMGRISNSGYGNDWFDALQKPAAMPPGWVFPLAWSLLYILLGLALALILRRTGGTNRTLALMLFAAQMVLNYSWSPVFFGFHQPQAALVIIVAMLVLSVAAAALFAQIDKKAGALMMPYLAWLGFASFLNYEIIRLNP
jgi:tryptophan-rich sensory protein